MLRHMTTADVDTVSSAINTIFGDEYRGHPITAQFAIEMDRSWIALDRGMVVGVALVTISQLGDEYLPELKIFGVVQPYRRRGIGRRMLEACGGDLFLIVRQSNVAAIRLYLSAGFEARYRVPRYYLRPAEHGIVMQKSESVDADYVDDADDQRLPAAGD